MVAGDTRFAFAKDLAGICFTPGPSAKTAAVMVAPRRSLATPHVAQHDRPPLPSNHLGRKPRARDRLRRSTAALPASRLAAEDIQAFLDKRRPGQSRFTTQRREPDAVRILSGVFADEAGTPSDHRHADLARHRQCRPARARLRRHQGQVPARPCRLHLPGEIRHPRLPRRRALVRARDGDARGRRRGRPQGNSRRHHPRRAGADRQAQDRPRPLELGRGRQQSVLLARRRHRRDLVGLSRRGAQGRLLGRRGDRGGGRGRARPAGARRSTASSTRTWPAP